MKLLSVLLIPFGIVYSSPSLRHELTSDELFSARLDALERTVKHQQHTIESLQVELSHEQQRHLSEGCMPFDIDGTCFFIRDTVFSNITRTSFEGPVAFKSPRYDSDVADPEFGVTFETEIEFKQEVLFEDNVEFEYDVLFERDVVMEGPDARRQRRKMRQRDLSAASDEDPTKFEIIGDVEIDFESDNEAHIYTETYFEEDVCVGCDDDSSTGSSRRRRARDRRRRHMGSSSRNDDDRARLHVKDADVDGELHVEGILEVIDHALFSKHLVMNDQGCLDYCDSGITVGDHDYCEDI